MNLLVVLNHHLKGGEFEYKSFDFKKAADEYSKTDEWRKQSESWKSIEKILHMDPLEIKDKYQIPEDIRDKHSYWRKGKLRKVEFNPNGSIFRIYIGAKYAIAFYNCRLDGLRLIEPNLKK